VTHGTRGGGAALRGAAGQGEQVVQSSGFEWLARAGLLARGVVYGVVAVLAIKLAIGDGGQTTDQQGALGTIAEQPFGKAMLILVAIGLAGYAIWRLVRAAVGHGPEAHDDAKERVGGVVSGIVNAMLCFTAVKILAGAGGGSGNTDKTTGGVLGWPAGTWIVGITGAIIVGVGLYQGYQGISKKFLEKSKTEQMTESTKRAFTAVGVAGHLARMVVFAMIGYFLVRAAIDYDPEKSIGLDGALAKLSNLSYGPVLLGIVAAGLLGFAAYSVFDSRYHRV
jgi:hypothetical protein